MAFGLPSRSIANISGRSTSTSPAGFSLKSQPTSQASWSMKRPECEIDRFESGNQVSHQGSWFWHFGPYPSLLMSEAGQRRWQKRPPPQLATSFMQTRLAVSLIFVRATNFSRMSAYGPSPTLRDVTYSVVIRCKADVTLTSPEGRF